MTSRVVVVAVIIVVLLAGPAVAQELPVPDPEVVHPNLRVTVNNLSFVKASDESKAAVAKAALAIVLSASNVKCDPASQVNSVLEANAESSLRTLSEKLVAASCLARGGTVHLDAEFTPSGSIQADNIVASIKRHEPLLMRWNGILYVLHGVVYDEHLHNSGRRENVIRQLLLIDPRYADERRFGSFDRPKDDFSQVEGFAKILFVSP